MNYEIVQAMDSDKENLALLRVDAMKESLEAIGRFDPNRARDRFINNFSSTETWTIKIENQLIGFYVVKMMEKYIFLDHLYIHPDFQGNGIGSNIINKIKKITRKCDLPIKVGALKESRANTFYKKHGFKKVTEEEWDVYYVFSY